MVARFTGGFVGLCLLISLVAAAPVGTDKKQKGKKADAETGSPAQAEPSSKAVKASKANKQSFEVVAIQAVLDAQTAAWNAGKLEEFMNGYWHSPELSFVSGGRRLNGWDATIERYRKTYQSGGADMGKVSFTEVDIQLLSRDAAFVRGKWDLTMTDGKQLGGRYTLLFRKFGDGWKIIHDHTSSN